MVTQGMDVVDQMRKGDLMTRVRVEDSAAGFDLAALEELESA